MTTNDGAPLVGFSHVQLRVTNLAESERWYSTVLDLERFAGSPADGYLGLRHRPSGVALVLSDAGDGAATGQIGLDHLAFATGERDALDAWGRHLADAGIEHSGLVEAGEGTSIHLRDPDGLAVELLTPRPRERR